MLVGMAVLGGVLGLARWIPTWSDAAAMTLSIPVGTGRSLVLMAAYRAIADDLPAHTGSDGSEATVHELRLRMGLDDRQQGSYDQLLDLTVPLWPWWPRGSATATGAR